MDRHNGAFDALAGKKILVDGFGLAYQSFMNWPFGSIGAVSGMTLSHSHEPGPPPKPW